MMFLVKLIDLFVGAVMFLLKKDRGHNPTVPYALGALGSIGLVVLMLITIGLPRLTYQMRTDAFTAEMANASGLTTVTPSTSPVCPPVASRTSNWPVTTSASGSAWTTVSPWATRPPRPSGCAPCWASGSST